MTSVRTRRVRRRVLWPVLGMVLAAICALVVVGLATDGLARGTVAAAVVSAMLPVVPVVGAFVWLDRLEPEPGRTMLAAFLWGAGVATLGAVVVNAVVALTYGEYTSSVVAAPFGEEALKGAFLVGLLWRHRRELDGVVDGIVYAGLVAAGFAFVENILYLGRAFDVDPTEGYAVFVIRGLITPFAHPLFTMFIGIAVGMAAHRTGVARLVLPVGGYLVAVGLHALWNASALWDGGRGFLVVYVVFMVPLFATMLGVTFWQRRREQRTVAAWLPQFVEAGWVPWYEVDLLATMRGRRRWVATIKRGYGRAAARAVRGYQAAVTELAFIMTRISRGLSGPEAESWRTDVLAAVAQARADVARRTGGGPQAGGSVSGVPGRSR